MEINVDFTTIVFVLFISTVIVYVLVSRTQQKRRLEKNGLRTEGIIVDLDFDHWSRISVYYPVVRYQTLDKENVRRKYSVGNYPASYEIGEKVIVIYNKDDTDDFILKKIN
ncbi:MULTISPECIES: DUF3592 domain-containing protein [unclassified Sphingobacterium]|uniref:DUF3592 domain-containing protein n=1 Tax=unclassified Sphingobacterium TaxID=2609468 RepID=UPI000FAD6704|nr:MULTISPECIES: DUF3592 domain-containing protein [unclassified Sphingobacterium]MCS3557630.1 hypothetical protein [Sphingobacterium sp. JUb21]TCQ95372.1 uncharacterized protein DUF3592 [Sphingobacterium sp. JUb20]